MHWLHCIHFMNRLHPCIQLNPCGEWVTPLHVACTSSTPSRGPLAITTAVYNATWSSRSLVQNLYSLTVSLVSMDYDGTPHSEGTPQVCTVWV